MASAAEFFLALMLMDTFKEVSPSRADEEEDDFDSAVDEEEDDFDSAVDKAASLEVSRNPGRARARYRLAAGSDDPAGCVSGRNAVIDVASFDAAPGRRLPSITKSPRDQQSARQHTAPAVRFVDLARRLITPLHHLMQGEHERDER